MTEMHYVTLMDPRFAALELIDVGDVAAAVTDRWYNETLCRVNDSLVRLGVLQGEYHWHAHAGEDEFFYVVDGGMRIELEGRPSVELGPQQGFVVPKALRHRPVVPKRSIVLMIEAATVTPTGG
jgi:mannose-6-phosphate isomerase-like protein (cupin superfamily)